jgi:hypothetical protein
MRYRELFEDVKVQQGLEALADAIIDVWARETPRKVAGYQGRFGHINDFTVSDVPGVMNFDIDPKRIPMPVRRLARQNLDIRLRYQDSYEKVGRQYRITIAAPNDILAHLNDADDLRQLLRTVRPSLVHELTHAWNDVQSKGRFIHNRRSAATRSTFAQYADDPSEENQAAWSHAYLNDPTEINAAFQAAVTAIPVTGSFDAYLADFSNALPQFAYWSPAIQQRLRTRLYKHWSAQH